MHRIMKCTIALSALAFSTAVWAQDDITYTSTANGQEVTHGYLQDEIVGILPQIGVIGFRDPVTGNYDARGAAGIGLDVNLVSAINRDWRNLFLGPSTGVVFSHLGDPSSNFFGTNAGITAGNSGSNLLVIPADAKLGYTFARNFRVSAHGGGNVMYRSTESSMNLAGATVATGGASTWNMYPNVGGDLEVGFGNNVALMLRPDWTLTQGDTVFMGTLALGIPLG